jgi:hypothetical protein
MLFTEIIAIYSESYTKHTNTLCGQNARCMSVEGDGTYSNRCCLRVKMLKSYITIFCFFIKCLLIRKLFQTEI